MKTITALDEKLKHWETGLPAAAEEGLPTFRQMYVRQLGASLAKDAEQSIAMFSIGAKIRAAEGTEVELEDAEFKTLKEKCESNAAQWAAHYQAQVVMKLRECEKIAEEKAKAEKDAKRSEVPA